MFKTVNWNEDLSCMYVFEQCKRFGGGCDDIDPRCGQLLTARNLETAEKMFERVAGDCWITLKLCGVNCTLTGR